MRAARKTRRLDATSLLALLDLVEPDRQRLIDAERFVRIKKAAHQHTGSAPIELGLARYAQARITLYETAQGR